MAAPWRNLVERVHVTYEICKNTGSLLHLRGRLIRDRGERSTGPCTLRQPRVLWLINLVGTHTRYKVHPEENHTGQGFVCRRIQDTTSSSNVA